MFSRITHPNTRDLLEHTIGASEVLKDDNAERKDRIKNEINHYIKQIMFYLNGHIDRSASTVTRLEKHIEELHKAIEGKTIDTEKFNTLETKKATLSYDRLIDGLTDSSKLVVQTRKLINHSLPKSEAELKDYISVIKGFGSELKEFEVIGKDHDSYFIPYPSYKMHADRLSKAGVTFKSLGYPTTFVSTILKKQESVMSDIKELIGMKTDIIKLNEKLSATVLSMAEDTPANRACAREGHHCAYELFRAVLERSWYVYGDQALAIALKIANSCYQ